MTGVVQFNENHKWCGAFGFISEEKEITRGDGLKDIRYMIGVPMLEKDGVKGTAYIFAFSREFDMIGKTDLVPKRED